MPAINIKSCDIKLHRAVCRDDSTHYRAYGGDMLAEKDPVFGELSIRGIGRKGSWRKDHGDIPVWVLSIYIDEHGRDYEVRQYSRADAVYALAIFISTGELLTGSDAKCPVYALQKRLREMRGKLIRYEDNGMSDSAAFMRKNIANGAAQLAKLQKKMA